MIDTTSQPTVCHVLHTLNVGGAETLARDFARQAGGGFRVAFACLDALGSMGNELREMGFEVAVFHRRPGFDFQCVRRMSAFFVQQNVQLIHAHQYAPFFYSSLARTGGGGYPILFTEHGRDYPDYRRPKRVWANRVLLRRRDRVVAVGECVKRALLVNEGLPANRVEVIVNGVDADRFDSLRCGRKRVRAELGLTDDAIGIIQVARLNRLKDFETAIRATASVCEQCPQARYYIVGEGEQRAKIERWIDKLGVRKQVRLLGLRRDIPHLLEGMDMFLLSSITEGIPLTLIEAMMAQLPCVATRVGGVPEVVLDGVTGFLAGQGQPHELADKMLALIGSQELRRRMGFYGRQRALQTFTATRMFAAYRRLYAAMTCTNVDPNGYSSRSRLPRSYS